MATVRERQRVQTRRPPKTVKARPAAPAPELKGLCVSCIHARACAFRRNPDQAVLQCEEFDSGTPLVVEETAPEVQTAPTEAELSEWDRFKGLCVNCESRHDCAIRDKEIGVWHCEEYS